MMRVYSWCHRCGRPTHEEAWYCSSACEEADFSDERPRDENSTLTRDHGACNVTSVDNGSSEG